MQENKEGDGSLKSPPNTHLKVKIYDDNRKGKNGAQDKTRSSILHKKYIRLRVLLRSEHKRQYKFVWLKACLSC